MDIADDSEKIVSVLRREAATTHGYIYLVRVHPSGKTTYVRWNTLPSHLQQAYLAKQQKSFV
jgi:hypothetical protein